MGSPFKCEPQNIGNCNGFDAFLGRRWVYPNNLPIRGYQKAAVEKALFNNAMIVLPTGMGKTFIAAVVMYNFHQWYPQGKIIFVAPTRPLVAQQIHECRKISGIPASHCIELTGSTPSAKREALWSEKRVIFATPQVIENDLESGILPATQVKCIVIDEAHRAQGGYAYVGIVRRLHEANRNGFRVLALSATPGSDIQKVQQVMMNLYIGDVMFRSESSLDLLAFKNQKISKAWTVELSGQHKGLVDKMIAATKPIYFALYKAGLTYNGDSIDRVAKYVLVTARQKLNSNEAGNVGRMKGKLNFYALAAMSLSSSFELLTLYGIRPFYASLTRSMDQGKGLAKTALAGSTEFDLLQAEIRKMFGNDLEIDMNKRANCDLLQGHPKLKVVKDLLMAHFKQNQDKPDTRAIVFTKYRDSVCDIVQTLKTFEPMIKPGPFVGQSDAQKSGSGMKQKDQIKMITDFKQGIYNVLVATCVAEEGLDIGEVDLIICYDTTSSPISNTQRRGRTGRKRSGDVQTLCTKGYEEKKLMKAGSSRRQVEDQLYKRENYMMHRYRDAPRLVPAGINPVCLEQKIFPVNDVPEEEVAPGGGGRRRKRRERNGEDDDENENEELEDDLKMKKKRKKKEASAMEEKEDERERRPNHDDGEEEVEFSSDDGHEKSRILEEDCEKLGQLDEDEFDSDPEFDQAVKEIMIKPGGQGKPQAPPQLQVLPLSSGGGSQAEESCCGSQCEMADAGEADHQVDEW